MNLKQFFQGRVTGVVLSVSGGLGILAAMQLALDQLHLLEDPGFVPVCSINQTVSCTPVIESWQSSVFGFPNSYLGLVSFAMILAVGVALIGKVKFPRWYMLIFNLGTLGGFIMVHWLAGSVMFDIGKLCLWCVLVWICTGASFVYTLAYNFAEDNLRLGSQKFRDAFVENQLSILLAWY
ncbi:vitamin K epoxide reductase family protein, partial [Candidatus Saccharibacteria bacterium]|nr:vitamin K epoxide reductase family protein [Candidatus Saccharibacteria bacterium]